MISMAMSWRFQVEALKRKCERHEILSLRKKKKKTFNCASCERECAQIETASASKTGVDLSYRLLNTKNSKNIRNTKAQKI